MVHYPLKTTQSEWTDIDQAQARAIALKYSNRVILVLHRGGEATFPLNRRKYVCPPDMTVGGVLILIRRNTTALDPTTTIFFFMQRTGTLLRTGQLLSECQKEHADKDNVLHIVYSVENAFGG